MAMFQTNSARYQPDHPHDHSFAAVNQRRLALVVGLVALLLPTAMLVASYNPWLPTCDRDSLSHYYYAPLMGSFFVGSLIFIGAYLIVYHGEDGDGAEYRLSLWAGIFAIGIALFPTSGHGCDDQAFAARAFVGLTSDGNGGEAALVSGIATEQAFRMFDYVIGGLSVRSEYFHYGCTLLLFAFLTWFCFFVFTAIEPHQRNADGSLTGVKTLRNAIYYFCGAVMAGAMLALILSFALPKWFGVPLKWWNAGNWTFWVEAFALWAFGLSWMVKGRFLGKWIDDAPDYSGPISG